MKRKKHSKSDASMSNVTKRAAAEIRPAGAGPGLPDGPEPKPEPQQSSQGSDSNHDVALELKRRLEETRLPASLKKQILAGLPSAEEQELLYRELQEKGGLSFDQVLDSLGLEVEPQR
jgi:hypothetical protein